MKKKAASIRRAKTASASGRVAMTGKADDFGKKRAQSVLELAEAQGLLEGGKGEMVRGRMPLKLVAAAKAKTGIKSDTKLIEVALANLAVADDYGAWLLSKAGSIPKDVDLEF